MRAVRRRFCSLLRLSRLASRTRRRMRARTRFRSSSSPASSCSFWCSTPRSACGWRAPAGGAARACVLSLPERLPRCRWLTRRAPPAGEQRGERAGRAEGAAERAREDAARRQDGALAAAARPLPRPRVSGRSPAPLPPQSSELPARDLVPGDVVELRVGDKARCARGAAAHGDCCRGCAALTLSRHAGSRRPAPRQAEDRHAARRAGQPDGRVRGGGQVHGAG